MKNIKKWAFMSLLLGLITGCANTNSVLNLSTYQSKTPKENDNVNLVIHSITDKRKNQSIVATITDSKGSVSEYITLGDNLKDWFGKALKEELIVRGVKFEGKDPKIVDITITDLKANLSGYSKDNLKANCEIYIRIIKDGVTITKRISQPQTEFAPVITSSAFTPFVQNLLNDMVVHTADSLTGN